MAAPKKSKPAKKAKVSPSGSMTEPPKAPLLSFKKHK